MCLGVVKTMKAKNLVAVCPDCAHQYPPDSSHSCSAQGQRIAAELIDDLIESFDNGGGAGLLWLYRIAYRTRQKMSGMEKYGDRAAMARKACGLGGELVA